jgi:hypothetical protein
MSPYPHYLAPGQLQFLTISTYRRNTLFAYDRFGRYLVEVLRELRPETGFLLTGWVLMPEQVAQTTAFVVRVSSLSAGTSRYDFAGIKPVKQSSTSPINDRPSGIPNRMGQPS